MRLGWAFFPCPDAAQQECCEPGSTLLCMGLFSRFFVQALPCTAEGTLCRVRDTRSLVPRAYGTNRSNSNTSCSGFYLTFSRREPVSTSLENALKAARGRATSAQRFRHCDAMPADFRSGGASLVGKVAPALERAHGPRRAPRSLGCTASRHRPMPSRSRNGSIAMSFSRAAISPRITQGSELPASTSSTRFGVIRVT